MRVHAHLTGLMLGWSLACGAAVAEKPMAAPAPASTDYLLDAGDKVRIKVFGEDKLSGEYGVTDSGDISFPLIGNVKAVGLPIETVQEEIRKRLAAGYLLDPRVAIEVLTYRPFYILGEVNHPGQFPFSKGMTVQQAAAAAGGFTYRANTKRVFLKRATDASEQPVDARKPVLIQPGDTIRIGERYF